MTETLEDLHRKLAAERLRADQGWARAEAKSKECIELRERFANVPAVTTPGTIIVIRTDDELKLVATICNNILDVVGDDESHEMFPLANKLMDVISEYESETDWFSLLESLPE